MARSGQAGVPCQASLSHLVEPGELLVPDECFLAGELAPAEQTGQLLPVGELLLPLWAPAFLLLLTVTLPAVGCHQPPRWALEKGKARGQAWLVHSPHPSFCPRHSLGGHRWPVLGGPCWCAVSQLVLPEVEKWKC